MEELLVLEVGEIDLLIPFSLGNLNDEIAGIEDVLFDMFRSEDDTVPIGKFLAVIKLIREVIRHSN